MKTVVFILLLNIHVIHVVLSLDEREALVIVAKNVTGNIREVLDMIKNLEIRTPNVELRNGLRQRITSTQKEPIALTTKQRILESVRNVFSRFHPSTTLLNYACETNNVELVDALLLLGEDPNEQNNLCSCKTPLYFATRNGNRGITQLLLDYGAHINTGHIITNVLVGDEVCNPLLTAVLHHHPHIVELLIQKGANTRITNINGTSIHTIAYIMREKYSYRPWSDPLHICIKKINTQKIYTLIAPKKKKEKVKK